MRNKKAQNAKSHTWNKPYTASMGIIQIRLLCNYAITRIGNYKILLQITSASCENIWKPWNADTKRSLFPCLLRGHSKQKQIVFQFLFTTSNNSSSKQLYRASASLFSYSVVGQKSTTYIVIMPSTEHWRFVLQVQIKLNAVVGSKITTTPRPHWVQSITNVEFSDNTCTTLETLKRRREKFYCKPLSHFTGFIIYLLETSPTTLYTDIIRQFSVQLTILINSITSFNNSSSVKHSVNLIHFF